jgi:hypothetical protein
MKPTTAARAAAVAATLLAAGLVSTVPAGAAESHPAPARITSAQLHASILKAANSAPCSAAAGLSVRPMGGYPPPVTGQ